MLGGHYQCALPHKNGEVTAGCYDPVMNPNAPKEILVGKGRDKEHYSNRLADQIDARYKKARSYTDKLTQSILAKAFRGELVPQDERDEPASVLLERIKAQKSENNSDKNRTPKRKAVNQSNLFE